MWPPRIIANDSALPKVAAPGIIVTVSFPVVHRIISDRAVLDVTPEGLVLVEVAPGFTPGDVCACTEPPLLGWTRTELVEPQIAARAQALDVGLEEGARNLLSEKQPSRQFVTVDQLGAVVAFLCSDAAAQLTGAAIPVDGGWTAQ
jgi:3-hydroxybutyrate dehydrogenase